MRPADLAATLDNLMMTRDGKSIAYSYSRVDAAELLVLEGLLAKPDDRGKGGKRTKAPEALVSPYTTEAPMTTDALLERIVNGRTDLVWDYVTQGQAATAQTGDGVRLLQWCAYFGDVSALRFLLSHGESLTSLGVNLGLHGAAFHGHWQLCEFLLEQGADVNAGAADTGETPLHSALSTPYRAAHDIVVGVLLAHGADTNRVTKPSVETGTFMRDCRTKGETPLHRAAAFGTEHAVDLLLGAGAAREAKDVNGDTPLGWASWYARPDAILRRLCYGDFAIHPDRLPLQVALLGRPHAPA